MPEIVVDASVAVKWFLPEVGEAEAREVLDRFTPIAPDWILAEVGHALDRRRRDGEISLSECIEAIGYLPELMALHSASDRVDKALNLAAQHDLTVYDAIYLALADDRKVGLITADRKLARAPGVTLLSG